MQVNIKREVPAAQAPIPSGNVELVKLDERRSQGKAVKAKSRQDASGAKGNGKNAGCREYIRDPQSVCKRTRRAPPSAKKYRYWDCP